MITLFTIIILFYKTLQVDIFIGNSTCLGNCTGSYDLPFSNIFLGISKAFSNY